MAAKIKVDQIETVDATDSITINNTVVMASGKTLPAASLTGTLPAISGANLTNLPADATKLPLAGGTMTGDLVTTSIEIAATNSGSPFNVLKFTDTDTGTAPNQAVGSIEFNSSDSGNTGVGAKIDAIAEDYDSNMAVRVFTGDPSSATEKMRITSAGKVGMGDSAPQAELSVFTGGNNGSGHSTGIQVRHNGYSGYKSGMTAGDTAATTHSCGFIGFLGGGHTGAGKRSIIFETRPGTTDAAPTKRLEITDDGRGLSQFTAKAWINFNGQNTVAIRDSHNVSSITDNGTGSYNVTMTNAMANVNYCVTAVSGRGNGEDMHALVPQSNFNFTTTQFRIMTVQSWDTFHDASYVGATVFGD
jgi:hypothetical protein